MSCGVSSNNCCEVRLIRTLTPEQFAELSGLYAGAEFVDAGDDCPFLEKMLKGSFLAAGAFTDNGRLVGFARALSDGVSDAYLQDVTVHRDYRKQGIGGRLVNLLREELERRGVDWIGLIATPEHAAFYRELGFAELTGFTPMKFSGKNN